MSWSYVLLVGPAELEGSPAWPARVAAADALAQVEAERFGIELAEPERTGTRLLAQADYEPAVEWVEFTYRQRSKPEPAPVTAMVTIGGSASSAGQQEELG